MWDLCWREPIVGSSHFMWDSHLRPDNPLVFLFTHFTIDDKYIFGMFDISLLMGMMTMIMNMMMMMTAIMMTMLYMMTTVVMKMMTGFSREQFPR